jgi:hypothetical protein
VKQHRFSVRNRIHIGTHFIIISGFSTSHVVDAFIRSSVSINDLVRSLAPTWVDVVYADRC